MAEYTVEQLNARIKADSEMTQLFKDDPTEFEVRANDIYHRFGYNPDGSPMSIAKKGIGKVSRATGVPEGIVDAAANIPIPAATTFAGALAGSYAPGPGTIVGASLGSVAGEEINYALGLRDKPGPIDLGIAAAAPALGPLLSRVKSPMSNVIQGLPGAGQHMHAVARETVMNKLKYMEVSKEEVGMMRGLFNAVPDFRTDVPELRKVLAAELSEATRSLKPDESYIKELNRLTKRLSTEKNISFKKLMATEHDFIKSGDAAPDQVWSKLSGVLVGDLEAQASNPKLTQQTRDKILAGVDSFKNYVAVNKRYQGQKALDSFLNRSAKQVDEDLYRFDKKAFLKGLEDPNLTKVFEPTELADMKKAVSELGFLGASPKSFTSNAIHTGSMGAAGLGAYAVGGVGGVVAMTAVLATIRLGLGSELGRRAITHLAKKGHGTIQVLELKEMLGKITAGVSGGAVAGVSGAGTQGSGVNPFANQE